MKTSSREGSGALHRVEKPISVRCGRGVVSVLDPTVLQSGVNTNVNRSNISSGVVRQIPVIQYILTIEFFFLVVPGEAARRTALSLSFV